MPIAIVCTPIILTISLLHIGCCYNFRMADEETLCICQIPGLQLSCMCFFVMYCLYKCIGVFGASHSYMHSATKQERKIHLFRLKTTRIALLNGTKMAVMIFPYNIPYSRKIWRGIKFGGMPLNRQIKISQVFLPRACTYGNTVPYRQI